MVKFREDIQCLRGICSLLVFIYHFNKNIAPTGFLGVDIFFLISGYVNILSFSHKINNNITFFYFNRFKRLFPVSHMALYISIFMAKRINIVYQIKHLEDIIFSALSVVNYRFIYLSIDYLSQSEPPSLVLHYWTLAVEEQFYMLFPFYILYVCNKNMYLYGLLIISLIYSCILNLQHHYLSYFSFFSRYWQFLLGIISSKENYISVSIFDNDILLYFILIFCFAIRNDYFFPSPMSLFPLIMIKLILSRKNSSTLLNNTLLLMLGNISYSFYIFHYLILYFKNNNNKSIKSLFSILLVTLLVSYIINKIYENPIRKIENKSIIYYSFFISLTGILLLCKYYINLNYHFMKTKFHSNSINDSISNLKFDKYYHVESNSLNYSPQELKKEWNEFQTTQCYCIFRSKYFVNNIHKFPIVLLLTDSHGEQWFNTIIPYAKSMNYIIIHVWIMTKTIFTKNFYNLNMIFKLLPKVKYVVNANYLWDTTNSTLFRNNYFLYTEIILKHCTEIYVIHDTPHFKSNPNLCLFSTHNYDICYSLLGINGSCRKFPIYKSKRIHYINMLKYICLNSYKCYYSWNSIPIYLDNNHLSFQFSKTLSSKLLLYIHFDKVTNNNSLNCNKSYRCSYKLK